MTLADVACEGDNTFTVVGEIEHKWLETASIWSEFIPDNFTEQDDGNVVLNLQKKKKEWINMSLFTSQWQYVSMNVNSHILYIYI